MVKEHEFALVLDDIRDPGNLGTIIRTADWYGIQKIIASEETADFYNPKVIKLYHGVIYPCKCILHRLEAVSGRAATTVCLVHTWMVWMFIRQILVKVD